MMIAVLALALFALVPMVIANDILARRTVKAWRAYRAAFPQD